MAKVGDTMDFYCMKEKKKVTAKVVVTNVTKRGTTMNKGICPKCGTKVCAISK